MDIDDESQADGGERTCPTRASEIIDARERADGATHEYESGIEVLVVLLDVVHIVLGCLSLVHRVEVDAWIVGLDWLEESSKSILKTTSGQRLPITEQT